MILSDLYAPPDAANEFKNSIQLHDEGGLT